ncbi:MAG: hypothetical protein C4529_00910 [Deltaproteobacteria bacterium]|nr:MAG: hypothetical protein C4529_00910 [Deltaproteobacteria bacterium]
MTKLCRLLMNVPVLRFGIAVTFAAALAITAVPPLLAADAPALPPGVTPQQAEAAKQMIRSGAQLPPEAKKAIEARPELKEQLPPDLKSKVEEKLAERPGETAPKNPADAPRETFGPLPPYDWRNSVYVGRLFSTRLHEGEVRSLPHFGHDLFAPRLGAASLDNMPPSPDYVVGPGDEIVVKMWGRVEGVQRMTVDRDGKIFFPKFGSIYVAGKTFEEMRGFLRSKVSTIAEVSSDVTLGQMKGIRVSLIGEVRAPGWYNVSSFHTALQLLSMAGGVKDIGSLRRIEVRRGNRAIETIDLYDFLLKGETGSDTRLLSGDTVFVPVVGKLAALAGEVRRPAIYELGREKTVLDLIKMAGGFTPSAYKRRIQVERLESHDAKIVLDLDAEELEKAGKAFDLSDGDIVRVLPIVRADVNAVNLEGNVVRPGKYELKTGMTVGALLPDVGAFLPETYFDYALLTRLVPPDLRKEVIPVNLRAIVLEGRKDADIPLKAQDTLTVYNRSAFRDTQKVTISGEVRRPGSFDLKKGSRVSDLVKLAGDLTKTSWLPRAEIVRIDEKRSFRTIYFDLGKAMEGDDKENHVLEDEDQVRVHSLWETQYRKTVTASGELNNPGEQILTEGMRLSDLLFKAGMFKASAYTKEAELVRREITPQGDLVKTQTLTVYPDKAAAGDNAANVPLREYDLLVVHQIPEWTERIQVTLSGEVQFPGTYTARKGERLSSLVSRAGGFTKDAYLKAAQFSRLSTQKTQQEAIEKLIEDLEMEVAQKGQQVSGALDKEDLEANKELLASRRALIAQLKKTRAKGRVIIHLAGNGKIEGTLGDVLLENGDRLEVPKKMNVVNVVGRVYNPTGVVYDPARDSVGYYLRLVGGPTESADRDHIFLLKADGSVVTRETADSGFFAFGDRGLMNTRVEPGDSILVPEKLVRTRFMKDVKDITQILYQIAVTAGVLLVAF